MKIKNVDFNINNFISDLQRNSDKAQAFDFYKFLFENKIDDFINIAAFGSPVFETKKCELSKPLTEKEAYNLVTEFYSKISKPLGLLVENIINNNDDRFLLNINSQNSSSVGVYDKNSYIDIDVNLFDKEGNVSYCGLLNLSHELGHSLSGNHIKFIETIRENGDVVNFQSFQRQFNVDCIHEIESQIIEFLFNKFLLSKKVIDKKTYKNYLKEKANSFVNDVSLIDEENEIYCSLKNPIKKSSLIKYYLQTKIKTKKEQSKRLKRLLFISKRDQKQGQEKNDYSRYRFRYVVGYVFASTFLEDYNSSSNKEKKKLLNKFAEYLENSEKFTFEDCCYYFFNCEHLDLYEEFLETSSKITF